MLLQQVSSLSQTSASHNWQGLAIEKQWISLKSPMRMTLPYLSHIIRHVMPVFTFEHGFKPNIASKGAVLRRDQSGKGGVEELHQ